ncbi:hypothetical protein ACUXHY_000289 [Cytobacillus horneckiae]|uniref:hypothetical protein n=1 Tax=Cytobacillus horneckiae TaxID=549687 RepID=UPI000C33BF90|nr:hypothetical protein [Cytobacillus horneckiae]MBN6885158.1 hypothetical protein [Cytobacillus horneckiae]
MAGRVRLLIYLNYPTPGENGKAFLKKTHHISPVVTKSDIAQLTPDKIYSQHSGFTLKKPLFLKGRTKLD